MSSNIRRDPQGHVLVTAAMIGSLAMLLAVGLQALGLIARTDGWLAAAMRGALSANDAAGFAKALPGWVPWVATGVVAYGLALAMLAVPGIWRRMVLWLSLLLLLAGWAPVLALASHAPSVSAPLIAGLWSGICSLVYARSHQMPCERPANEIPPLRP